MFSRRQIRKETIPSTAKIAENSKSHGNATKRNVRSEVLASGLGAAIQSALVGFVFVIVVTSVVVALTGYISLLTIPLLIAIVRWKRLAFEFFLVLHVIENSLDIWPWYTLVDTDLYLGAIPLTIHGELLPKKLKIGSVLSLNENFELTVTTVVGKPITPNDWKRMDINFLQLSTPDFNPPPFSILDEGANFLNAELSEGRKVYCHCKSGVGRSASVVVAYFIKYRGMDVESAHNELLAARPVIFKKNSRQMAQLREYEKWLRQQNK